MKFSIDKIWNLEVEVAAIHGDGHRLRDVAVRVAGHGDSPGPRDGSGQLQAQVDLEIVGPEPGSSERLQNVVVGALVSWERSMLVVRALLR